METGDSFALAPRISGDDDNVDDDDPVANVGTDAGGEESPALVSAAFR